MEHATPRSVKVSRPPAAAPGGGDLPVDESRCYADGSKVVVGLLYRGYELDVDRPGQGAAVFATRFCRRG